jgi:hypothetical protein
MARWLPWLLLAAAVGAGAYLAHELERARAAEAEARRAVEVELLEQQGLVVELEVRAGDAEKRAAKAESAIPDLRVPVNRALAAAPGGHVVEVVEARSAPLVAGGEPRSPEPPGVPPPPCLVAPGDRIELRSAGVTIEYREGSRVPVLAGEAWRLEPGPPTRIVAGELVVSSAAIILPSVAEPARGWAFGGAVFGSFSGAGGGVAIGLPPIRLLGRQLEVTGAGGFGPRGLEGVVVGMARF